MFSIAFRGTASTTIESAMTKQIESSASDRKRRRWDYDSTKSSSSSVAAELELEPEAPSSSLVQKSIFGKVVGGGDGSIASSPTSQPALQSPSRRLLAFFLATTVLGSNGGGNAKVVVDNTQVDRTVFIISSHDQVVS